MQEFYVKAGFAWIPGIKKSSLLCQDVRRVVALSQVLPRCTVQAVLDAVLSNEPVIRVPRAGGAQRLDGERSTQVHLQTHVI